MLDLFCGKWGWSRAFAVRGWDCIGVDLIDPGEIPERCVFEKRDILTLTPEEIKAMGVGFICASSPCEQFSIHGMKNFHPNPPYPELGIKLFEHTRMICEKSGIPYIMENVRSAQQFVGNAAHHCGPFYFWGSAVPVILPQGISKGINLGNGQKTKKMTPEEKRIYRKQFPCMQVSGIGRERKVFTAKWATIPNLLSNCVADYAERIAQ